MERITYEKQVESPLSMWNYKLRKPITENYMADSFTDLGKKLAFGTLKGIHYILPLLAKLPPTENIITKDNNKIKSEEQLHEIRPGLLDAIRIHKKEQRTQDEAFFDAGLSNQKNKLS
ncbi:hypothetical protein BDE02_13G059400 [Populus trichocarpa]|jgi:hypothetical protein|nr:hypothetical protein BDE02_13G059400 [Populus trichocarpa]